MRSIVQKKESNRTNQILLGVGLVVIMFISVAGYSLQSQGNGNNQNNKKITYNGFDFVNQNGLWFLEIGSFQFYFNYNPNQVKRSNSQVNLLNTYSGKPLYIYSEDNSAASEIYQNLFYQNGIVQRIQSACLNESCDENSPVKTCSDNFILIKANNETSITQNESCVFIEGPKENLTRITDEFLFKILGVD